MAGPVTGLDIPRGSSSHLLRGSNPPCSAFLQESNAISRVIATG